MKKYDTIIVIPARYGSTRFPGKPLAAIAGKTLLQRVCEVATQAAKQMPDVGVLVATDDDRIMQHVSDLQVNSVFTPRECATGSDRALAAIKLLPFMPRNVINLQGDAPLTPVSVIIDLLQALQNNPIVTPVMQLRWADLDVVRTAKKVHPFSGTTAIINKNNEAVWFSKQIIPAIRGEDQLRSTHAKSPVFQHLGVYGYAVEMLEIFSNLPLGYYEQLEGLEQLRFLENGYKIKAVPINLDNLNAWRGVDTLEDAQFVETIILEGTHV